MLLRVLEKQKKFSELNCIKNKTTRINLLDNPPNEDWNRTYGGTGSDFGGAVQQTPDGGYIVTGYSSTYGAGLTDSWLLKTEENGNEQWNQTYGGENVGDIAYFVQQTSDGGYIISGTKDMYNYTYGWDIWVIKTDSNGDETWNKSYGVLDFLDQGCQVRQTIDRGYIAVADTASYGAGINDAMLIKIASDNNPPEKPARPSGPINGKIGTSYNYSSSTIDPDGHQVYYNFSWGDGNYSEWLGPYGSGDICIATYAWSEKGNYDIRVKAKDIYDSESDWSDSITVVMPRSKNLNSYIFKFFV